MRMSVSSDSQTGTLQSRSETLVADTVTEFTIPNDAQYLRLHPVTNPVRFAINENPDAITAGAWLAGGTAFADVDEVRVLPLGVGRTLRLLSDLGGVVYLEVS